MKIKKYFEYVKESKKSLNEDFGNFDQDINQEELEQDFENEPTDLDMPIGDERPDEFSDDLSDEFSEEPINQFDSEVSSEEEVEEEGSEYYGRTMLTELGDKLGAEVIDGSIIYNGKNINFYSETDSFHVDKKKFKTVEEVVDYLTDVPAELPTDMSVEAPVNEEEPVIAESKSYKVTRKFNKFRK
jgi:hypothetical protein